MVKAIHTDGEGAIVALKQEIENSRQVEINPRGPGQHVHIVERKIRTIKETVRGVLHSLGFKLCNMLLMWLVLYAVSRINLFPNKTGYSNISPREAFTGRRADVTKDARIAFGDYAQAFNPHVQKNGLEARTDAVIALQPLHTGSVKFLSLTSGRVVTRDQWTQLPMPDAVITFLNNLAIKQVKGEKQDDLVFKMGSSNLAMQDQVADMPVENINELKPIQLMEVVPADEDIVEQNNTVNTIVPLDEAVITDILPEQLNSDVNQDQLEPLATQANQVTETNEIKAEEQVSGQEPTTAENHVPQHRYSTRSSNRGEQRTRFNPLDHSIVESDKLKNFYALHITVSTAIKKLGDKAFIAIRKELQQLLDKTVFEFKHENQLSNRQLKKIIRSSMFLKEKFDAAGIFEKLKARLVAGGDMQDRNLYEDVSSPTASLSSLLMVAAIAALEERIVITCDITGAYLNATMGDIEVLMSLDSRISSILISMHPELKQYLTNKGTMIVRLRKALYGCIESAKLWYQLLSETLIEFGFQQNTCDKCVFNKDINGVQCTIVVYVDDLFISCKCQQTIDDVYGHIKEKFKEVTRHDGNNHSYLGMNFDFSTKGEAKITMNGYINDVLRAANIKSSATTPATEHLFEIRDNVELLSTTEKEYFHSMVAKLLYLAKRARPDIMPAVPFLTTRVLNPNKDDLAKLERVLKYLYGTKEIGIRLKPTPNQSPTITAWIDASHAVHHDMRGHSGTIIAIGEGPCFVRSSKQKSNTKSSTESELLAISDDASQVIWCRNFLIAQGYELPPAKIYQDNMSTIALIKNGRANADKSRHINIRHFWLKNKIEDDEITIDHLKTDKMKSDILTKPLQGSLYIHMRDDLLNWYV